MKFRKYIPLFLALLLLFTSCKETVSHPPVTTAAQTQTLTESIKESSDTAISVNTDSNIIDTAAEDTEIVSSERYTIKHTVHDMTQQLPKIFSNPVQSMII